MYFRMIPVFMSRWHGRRQPWSSGIEQSGDAWRADPLIAGLRDTQSLTASKLKDSVRIKFISVQVFIESKGDAGKPIVTRAIESNERKESLADVLPTPVQTRALAGRQARQRSAT
jgi:hypothetical protein